QLESACTPSPRDVSLKPGSPPSFQQIARPRERFTDRPLCLSVQGLVRWGWILGYSNLFSCRFMRNRGAYMVSFGRAQSDGGNDQSGLFCADALAPGLPVVGTGGYVYVYIKSGIEWIASLILLVITLPVICGLLILIKCASEGPVFYSQLRLGRNGKPFRLYKLRTMTLGCEAATGQVW